MIFVISGSGGVGKGALVSRLIVTDPRLWLSRSWTTRSRRPGEPPDSYTFVSRESFLALVAAGGFLEYAEFLGHLYGTPLVDPPPGRDLLLEIDVQGAEQVRRRRPEAVIILVVPPSRDEQRLRLVARGDDREAIARRLAMAEAEEAAGRRLADQVVVNDDLDQAVAEVSGMIEQYRTQPPRETRGEDRGGRV